MVYCAVFGYSNNNRKKKNWRFFRFPKDKNICKQWVLSCLQPNKFNLGTARICSDHFGDSAYCLKEKLLQLPQNKWKLKSDAIPSMCLFKPPNALISNQQKPDIMLNTEFISESQQKLKISNIDVRTEPEMSDFQMQGENVHEKESIPEETVSTLTTVSEKFQTDKNELSEFDVKTGLVDANRLEDTDLHIKQEVHEITKMEPSEFQAKPEFGAIELDDTELHIRYKVENITELESSEFPVKTEFDAIGLDDTELHIKFEEDII